MTKKKILIIYDDKEKNNIIYFLNNIDYKQNEVDLLIEDNIKIKKELSKKVNLIKYNSSKINKHIFKIKFLLKYKNKYDNSYLFESDNLFTNKIIRKVSKNKTIFIRLNNVNEFNFREYFIKRNIYEFNKLIFKTYEDETTFLKHYPTLSKKTSVINDFIFYEEIENLSKQEIEEKIKKTDKTILLITKLNEEKNNILNTLRTIKEIKENVKNIKLYIIGGGIDKFAYESFIEDNNLQDTIFLLGEKDNVFSYINKCKYILLNNRSEIDKYLIPSYVLNTIPISKCHHTDDIIDLGNNFGYIISTKKTQKEEIIKIINNKKNKKNLIVKKINEKKLENLIREKKDSCK